MAVLRQANFISSQRLDVPHLRALESSITADFDVLAGQIMAGQKGYVGKGFDITQVGVSPSSLLLNVGGGVIVHPLASESGSIFAVPADTLPEQLSGTNPKVIGSFTANTTNYVGLDLRRVSDPLSTDIVTFRDADTGLESPRSVPLARILTYRIVISNVEFGATPTILPLARVITNSSNNITSLSDARPRLFRLGTGGTQPSNLYRYAWPTGRSETAFTGGDKAIGSLKDWMDAVMSRIQELSGGENWFAPNSDRDLKLVTGQPVIGATGDNFQFVLGTQTLTWASLALSFGNSTVTGNTIQDGSAVILDGQCLYVDANRTSSVGSLVPQVVNLTALGASSTAGGRVVIAWRRGNLVYIKDRPFEVGRASAVATTTTAGVVALSGTPGSAGLPQVAAIDAGGRSISNGVTTAGSSSPGTLITIGGQAADGAVTVGKTATVTTIAGSTIVVNGPLTSAAALNIGTIDQTALTLGRIASPTTITGSTVTAPNGIIGIGVGTRNGITGLGAGTTGTVPDGSAGGYFAGSGAAVGTAFFAGGVALAAQGAPDRDGVVARSGGGGSNAAVRALGGTLGATGIVAQGASGGGAGEGVGGRFVTGIASSATVRYEAIQLNGGDITFSTVTPASSTAMTNRLTAMNTPKVFAKLTTSGNAAVSINSGFGITSVTAAGTALTVTMAQAMTDTNYCVLITGQGASGIIFTLSNPQVGSFTINAYDAVANAQISFQPTATQYQLSLLVMGAQS